MIYKNSDPDIEVNIQQFRRNVNSNSQEYPRWIIPLWIAKLNSQTS